MGRVLDVPPRYSPAVGLGGALQCSSQLTSSHWMQVAWVPRSEDVRWKRGIVFRQQGERGGQLRNFDSRVVWWLLLYVSTWLGYWMPRYLVKYYSRCLNVKLIAWVKQIALPSVGLIQSVEGLNNKRLSLFREKGCISHLTVFQGDFISFLPSGSNWNFGPSWGSSLLTAALRTCQSP